MEEKTAKAPTPTPATPETPPTQRLLDPFAEPRDHANRWDVSELWRTPKVEEDAQNQNAAENKEH